MANVIPDSFKTDLLKGTFNFDSSANTDDGSCIPFVYGCKDSEAFNYNS